MKLVFYKIKLPHTPGMGYQYPSDYNNIISKYNQSHLYYDDKNDGVFTLLIAIPELNKLSSLPTNVSEVTELEARKISDDYDPSVEIITNDAVVRRLEIKSQLGLPLSSKENDALDPTKNELGFGMSETFNARVDKKKLL